MARKKEPTEEELVTSIREEFETWKKIKVKGSKDPFWPDGVNLNLVRNHIYYYQEQLRELCQKTKVKRCPREARLKLPREMSQDYLSPGTKKVPYYSKMKMVARKKVKRSRS